MNDDDDKEKSRFTIYRENIKAEKERLQAQAQAAKEEKEEKLRRHREANARSREKKKKKNDQRPAATLPPSQHQHVAPRGSASDNNSNNNIIININNSNNNNNNNQSGDDDRAIEQASGGSPSVPSSAFSHPSTGSAFLTKPPPSSSSSRNSSGTMSKLNSSLCAPRSSGKKQAPTSAAAGDVPLLAPEGEVVTTDDSKMPGKRKRIESSDGDGSQREKKPNGRGSGSGSSKSPKSTTVSAQSGRYNSETAFALHRLLKRLGLSAFYKVLMRHKPTSLSDLSKLELGDLRAMGMENNDVCKLHLALSRRDVSHLMPPGWVVDDSGEVNGAARFIEMKLEKLGATSRTLGQKINDVRSMLEQDLSDDLEEFNQSRVDLVHDSETGSFESIGTTRDDFFDVVEAVVEGLDELIRPKKKRRRNRRHSYSH